MNNKLFNKTMGEIIGLFISQGNSPLHGREITRQLNKNQRTVLLCLNNLVTERILTMHHAGKNKQFQINQRNPKAENIRMISELLKTGRFLENFEIELLIEDIKRLTRDPFLIFGSYAKGYAVKESDIDILVITDKKISQTELQSKVKIKIHLITVSAKRFEEGIKKRESFPREVITNHIIIQGYEYFIKLWGVLYGDNSLV